MEVGVHRENNVLHLRLDDSAIAESQENSNGIMLNYSAEGKVAGIGVLHLSQRSPNSGHQTFLEATP